MRSRGGGQGRIARFRRGRRPPTRFTALCLACYTTPCPSFNARNCLRHPGKLPFQLSLLTSASSVEPQTSLHDRGKQHTVRPGRPRSSSYTLTKSRFSIAPLRHLHLALDPSPRRFPASFHLLPVHRTPETSPLPPNLFKLLRDVMAKATKPGFYAGSSPLFPVLNSCSPVLPQSRRDTDPVSTGRGTSARSRLMERRGRFTRSSARRTRLSPSSTAAAGTQRRAPGLEVKLLVRSVRRPRTTAQSSVKSRLRPPTSSSSRYPVAPSTAMEAHEETGRRMRWLGLGCFGRTRSERRTLLISLSPFIPS